ncbi:hypothetical protein [Clostridium sp. DMHC 10]|uniref:hypothetical protein n=1 Tax=Clostridium sp. DMHC 10 TaxID=747377 RepID=UPI00325C2FE2
MWFISNKGYEEFDALKKFELSIKENRENSCVCGEIILGKKCPSDCSFFGKKCTPSHPIGPCMVSSEGSCSIYFRYRGENYE